MSRYAQRWAPYVAVADRRAQAEREIAKLRKKGQSPTPVVVIGRSIATSFWGKAWCETLESYRDYENRLPRGRSYVKNGLVVDLKVAPLGVTALVSGSSIYKVSINVAGVSKTAWRAMCSDCIGGIDTLVELLQGRFSKGVMERLCRQDKGLFPRPSEIKFCCSCLDYASMCKHVAAVLYGIGARLDQSPELLFRLRAVDENDLLADLDAAMPLAKAGGPATGRILEGGDMSALFGLDMASAEELPAPAHDVPKPAAPNRAASIPRGTGKGSKRNPGSPSVKITEPRIKALTGASAQRAEKREKPALELTPDGFVKWWK